MTVTMTLQQELAQITATIEALEIRKIEIETAIAIEKAQQQHDVATKRNDLEDNTPEQEARELAKAKERAAKVGDSTPKGEYYKPANEVAIEKVSYEEFKQRKASRVKRSKQVDTIVEKVKGKRDIDAGTAAKIDETKEQAVSVRPAKVAQEKRTTKKPAAEKAKKQPGRKHEGMTYAEVRSEVSTRKAALNKADQERMSKAGLKNNTWEGAIASLEWLNKYFAK